MQGQINIGSKMGNLICDFVRKPEVFTIVEIGTWNGLGSTRCVEATMNEQKENNGREYKFYTVESSGGMYNTAIKNKISDFSTFINGRIVEKSDLLRDGFTEADHPKWLKEDEIAYDECPNVYDQIPKKIDLLILDGGEFSSYKEFKLLAPISKYIFLDDTFKNTIKFVKIRKEIISGTESGYKVLFDEKNDRNGFMVLQNKNI